MTNAQLTGIREMAATNNGSYQIIDRNGFVVMFGLTKARADEYAKAHGYVVKGGR